MAAPTHWEVAPYPRGRYTNGDFYGERRVECAGTDIGALLDWLDASANHFWPYNGFGAKAMDAVVVDANAYPKPKSKVISNSAPLIQFEKYWVDLTYSTKDMTYVGGRYVHEKFVGGLKNMQFAAPTGLMWGSDSTPVLPGAHLSGYAPAGTYFLTQFRLAVSPPGAATLQGYVNSVAFQTLTLGYTFAAGTLLYNGATVERGSPGCLTSSWKYAQHVFSYNPLGWNLIPRPETGSMETVYMPNGNPLYLQSTANLYGVLI